MARRGAASDAILALIRELTRTYRESHPDVHNQLREVAIAAIQLDDQVGSAIELVSADCIALEPVRWLWPGYVPLGMLTLLAGKPGAGNTTLPQSIAATVTRGAGWPDGSRCTAPGDVIVWSGEDCDSALAARLARAGADLSRVHLVSGDFDPARDMPSLEHTLSRLQAPRLLILDPIVSAVAGDSHKAAEVRRSLQPVVDLARRLGVAVLGVSHFAKGTGGRDPLARVVGSGAFGALARLVLLAATAPDDDDGDRRLVIRVKSNLGPDSGGFGFRLERVPVAPGVEGQRVLWGEEISGSAARRGRSRPGPGRGRRGGGLRALAARIAVRGCTDGRRGSAPRRRGRARLAHGPTIHASCRRGVSADRVRENDRVVPRAQLRHWRRIRADRATF